MLLEGLTDVGRCLIVVEVILFLPHRETTLIDVQDVLRGVLLVSTKATEEELLLSIRSLLQLDGQQLVVGLGSLQALDERHEGSYTLLIPADRVHRKLIEVAELLLQSAFLIAVLKEFLQDAVHPLVVVFLQTVEAAIAGIGCRQGILLHPSATSVFIEVITRTNSLVEVRHIQSGAQSVLCHCHQ